MNKNDSGKQRQFWVGMVISLVCLSAIFFFVQPAEIGAALQSARYEYLIITALGVLAFLAIRALRWRFMLHNHVPYGQVFHIQNIGYMLTNLLPLRIGDVARAVLIGNVPPVTIAQGISTMVVERIMDMLFIITLLPFTLSQVDRLPDWFRSGMLISGFGAVGAIVVLIVAANQRPFTRRIATLILNRLPFLDTTRWVTQLDNLLAGLDSLTHWRDGLILILLSILTWLPVLLAYYTGLLAVNIPATPAMAGFVVCAAALSVAAPSSPGQIGVFHAGVLAALSGVLGQPEAESFNFALLYHGINLVGMVLLGLVGTYATGSTFGKVVESTQTFLRRKENTTHP